MSDIKTENPHFFLPYWKNVIFKIKTVWAVEMYVTIEFALIIK